MLPLIKIWQIGNKSKKTTKKKGKPTTYLIYLHALNYVKYYKTECFIIVLQFYTPIKTIEQLIRLNRKFATLFQIDYGFDNKIERFRTFRFFPNVA